jgi:D-alanyl-D-alanine carboxypeptidase
MLPSGNDAAHCLAEYFGTKLKAIAEENEKKEKAEEAERLKREKELGIESSKNDFSIS